MGCLVEQAIEIAVNALVNQDVEKANQAIKFDDEIDQKEKDIETLCMKLLLQQQPVAKDLRLISAALKMITDMERIGDHADNIGELVLDKIENKVIFSDKANEDLREMFEETKKMYKETLTVISTMDCDECNKIIANDDIIDEMYKNLRKNHIERLNNFVCEPSAGIVFLDIISNLERIGDHSTNIAESILEAVANKNEKKS